MYFSAIRLQKQYKDKLESIASLNIPIFFVGMMGSGKTTIGRIVAQMLNYHFLDMDSRIEIADGRTVKKIFSEMGESYFRQKEADLLNLLIKKTNTVISCGGGVFIFESNIQKINDHGISVFLNVSQQIIEARLANDKKRPLLQGMQTISEIMEARILFYKKAQIIIDITKQDIKTNVIQCVEALHQYRQQRLYA